MNKSIDIVQLKKLLSGGGEATLLDVRRRADADAFPRCIRGAGYRDPEKIEAWIGDLSPGKPAVVYCVKGGSVSRQVAETLRQKGIEAFFLEGGLKAWTDRGLAVEPADT